MEAEKLEIKHDEILSYVKSYEGKVKQENASQVFAEFKEEWKNSIDYLYCKKNMGEEYGKALIIYSVSIYEEGNLTEAKVKRLTDLIDYYCEQKCVQYKFNIKVSLYVNLGLCWHKLGKSYDAYSLKAFKKYAYYLLSQTSYILYQPTAYAFKTCSKYLLEALTNEELNISSPSCFNDPFDSPILELLNNSDEISQLLRQAYSQCLKITCFSSNMKLPQTKNNVTIEEPKHPDDQPEYLNELMWAHYADAHKGICIKYHFPNSISIPGAEDPNRFCYFKDVRYSDQDISKYSTQDTIDLNSAFFLKGEQWEYENELRFLYFDINGKEGYDTIKIKNCIEAIYFGLNCSEEDKNTIINILHDRVHKKVNLNNEISEFPIKFFKMEIDKEHFGELKAVEITMI